MNENIEHSMLSFSLLPSLQSWKIWCIFFLKELLVALSMVREFLRCCCGLAVAFGMRYPITWQYEMWVYHRLRVVLYIWEPYCTVMKSSYLQAVYLPHTGVRVYVCSLSSRQISIILDYRQNALPDRTAMIDTDSTIRLNKSHGYKTSVLTVTNNKY